MKNNKYKQTYIYTPNNGQTHWSVIFIFSCCCVCPDRKTKNKLIIYTYIGFNWNAKATKQFSILLRWILMKKKVFFRKKRRKKPWSSREKEQHWNEIIQAEMPTPFQLLFSFNVLLKFFTERVCEGTGQYWSGERNVLTLVKRLI